MATLGLSDVSYDDEDYWEWAIGTLDGVRLDVTRTHQHPAASVDTRVFRLDLAPIASDLLAKLTERLSTVARGPISWGRWMPRQGNDFDFQVIGCTGND